jgi:hypothetical protein
MNDDFIFAASGQTSEQVRDSLAVADAPAPETPAPTETPAAETPTETPVAADASVDEAVADPAAGVDPAVAAAAAKLPTGDSKAGKTLSDRARTIQAEIHQLTAQKYASRQELEAARAELQELQAARAAVFEAQRQQQHAPPPDQKKPESKDFETFEEYTEALTNWRGEQAERTAVAKVTEQIEQRFAHERARIDAERRDLETRQTYAQHQSRIEAARASHPDFDEAVSQALDLPTNPMMDTHIIRSPLGGELMHYLATHPDECATIAELPAGPTLVALGRLEARLETAKSGPVSSRPPTSKAQPPIKPVGGSSGSADDIPNGDVSLDEHVSFWNRKERESRRR